MSAAPWLASFDALFNRIEEKRAKYIKRCTDLGVRFDVLHDELWLDLIARIVHESNWQENLYLDIAETKALTNLAFDEKSYINGPHLDINKICQDHRDNVVTMKRNNKSAEEIAAFNLAVAHRAVVWISDSVRVRLAAQIVFVLKNLRAIYTDGFGAMIRLAADAGATQINYEAINPLVDGLRASASTAQVDAVVAMADKLLANRTPFCMPLTEDIATVGELVSSLSEMNLADLRTPMNIPYIHLLHTLTTMGLSPATDSGHFRTTQVHVGNPDLIFPLPSLVPKLMEEYCQQFRTPLVDVTAAPSTPAWLPMPLTCTPRDLLLLAAEQSHHFVRIHPYRDGNGRVSRLLMNLVLRFVYPPVYIKADKQGRHRYSQALRRADNGKFKPLASLILMSLNETYDKLLASVTFPPTGSNTNG